MELSSEDYIIIFLMPHYKHFSVDLGLFGQSELVAIASFVSAGVTS